MAERNDGTVKAAPDTIWERVYVETPVDTDRDGRADLVAVYIRRPAGTLCGGRTPAVLVASPYMMGCREPYQQLDVDQPLAVYPEQQIRAADVQFDAAAREGVSPARRPAPDAWAQDAVIPEAEAHWEETSFYRALVRMGYAAVFCGGLGTKGSEGCTIPGSREEIRAFCAVIDWLCGRGRAFTDRTARTGIRADWCTGDVAMTGKSYLGTLCIGVAATGVEGLRTIIPEAGISNWYAYYRTGGLCVAPLDWQGDDLSQLAVYCFSREAEAQDAAPDADACADGSAGLAAVWQETLEELKRGQDRASGNYNRFWDERNYLNHIADWKASVCLFHGLNDWNVKTNQCIPLFQALEQRGVACRMLLHQGEHISIFDLADAGVPALLAQWLDHYLRGVENGVERGPAVLVESNVDQRRWMASDTWPPRDGLQVPFPIPPCTAPCVIVDDLAATAYRREQDDRRAWLDQLVLSEEPTYRNRVRFLWDPFAEQAAPTPLRISGTVQVTFDAALDRETAILSVMLAELGEDCRITAEEVRTGDGDTFRFGREKTPSPYRVISRGWLNAQNRDCLWRKTAVRPGETCRYTIEMIPTDYTVKPGHRLALILYGIDAELTLRPDTVTTITVDPASIRAILPVAADETSGEASPRG